MAEATLSQIMHLEIYLLQILQFLGNLPTSFDNDLNTCISNYKLSNLSMMSEFTALLDKMISFSYEDC